MALRSASHARRTAAYSFQVDACLLKQQVGFRQFDKSCLGTVNEFVRSNGLPLTIWQCRGGHRWRPAGQPGQVGRSLPELGCSVTEMVASRPASPDRRASRDSRNFAGEMPQRQRAWRPSAMREAHSLMWKSRLVCFVYSSSKGARGEDSRNFLW